MNKSYKCDFCKFDTGPLMEPKAKCVYCSCGRFFALKKRMSQRQTYEWERHQKLDRIIDGMDIEVLASQREFLHRSLDRKVYLSMPPQIGRTDFKLLMAVYEAIFDSEEKEQEK